MYQHLRDQLEIEIKEKFKLSLKFLLVAALNSYENLWLASLPSCKAAVGSHSSVLKLQHWTAPVCEYVN